MKKVILFFAFILFSMGMIAQSLNCKLGTKIEKTTTYRDGKYRDSFVFSVYPTEKIHIRMFSFEIKEALLTARRILKPLKTQPKA